MLVLIAEVSVHHCCLVSAIANQYYELTMILVTSVFKPLICAGGAVTLQMMACEPSHADDKWLSRSILLWQEMPPFLPSAKSYLSVKLLQDQIEIPLESH